MSGETLQFWGLVGALSIVALGILLLPLVRRRTAATAIREEYDINVYKDQLLEIERDLDRRLMDETQAEAARLEIKRRMLAAAEHVDDAKVREPEGGLSSNLALIAVIVVALPAAALAMYLNLGRPGQPDQPFAQRPAPTQVAGAAGNSDLSSVTEKLKKRLQGNPDDLRGWMLLGRSYMSLSQFTGAADAYGRAYGLSGEDAEIGAEYGEALSLVAGSVITSQAKGIFETTLAADPFNAKARFYLAMFKAQDGDTRGALQGWVDLAAISAPGAPWMQILNGQIVRAGKELGIDPQTIKPSAEATALALTVKQPKPKPQMTTAPDASAPGPTQADVEAAGQMSGEDRSALIRTMVKRLADRLKENPDDKAGWQRLERAYRVLGETGKADEAAAMAAKLP